MTKLRWILLGVATVPIFMLATSLAYYLPSTVKVRVTGTEIKRMDHRAGAEGKISPTRDVRLIIARSVESQKTLVFRNEDTRWGWPFYFKFNSGTLAGDAINIVQTDPDATVLLTFYGWRLEMFDLYPNVVDLDIVEPDYEHLPLFNIIFLAFLFGGTGFGAYRVRRGVKRFRERREQKRQEKLHGPKTTAAEPPVEEPTSEEAAPDGAAETSEVTMPRGDAGEGEG